MHPRKEEGVAIQRRIGEVLLRHWDPLSVADLPEVSDEYNAYVGGVYRLLASGASARQIAEHLARVEADSLGYPDTGFATLQRFAPFESAIRPKQ